MDGQSDYIGNMGGAGAGGQVGQIDYAAAAPGSKWKAVGAITERDIARIRARGGLYKLPRVFIGNGRSGKMPPQAGVNGTASGLGLTRAAFCIGPECAYSGAGDNNAFTAAPLNTAVNFGSSYIYLGSTINGPGLSFANGELHLFRNTPSLVAGVPPHPNFIFQTGGTNGAAWSPTTYTSPGAAYNQLCYGNGKYVAWQQGGGSVLKYSSDRNTWTNCPVAGLNADGAAAGATPAMVIFDPIQQLFIMISVYGEIAISSDGITFTKSYARAAGGTTHGLEDFCVTKDGVLLATGTGAGNGQFYSAPSIAGPFSLVTAAIAGKTFASRARGVAYSAGVTFLAFRTGATATDVQTCFSRDERLTYEFATGGATSNTLVYGILASAGVAVLLDATAGSAFTDRIGTDWGNAVASASHDDFYTLPAGAGTKLNAYVRTA